MSYTVDVVLESNTSKNGLLDV